MVDLIQSTGALVQFLPPYSPDIMPIEELFSKIKGVLKVNKNKNIKNVTRCTVLCYHPYLVSMLFADLLSLHLVTFLMFIILVHVTFF